MMLNSKGYRVFACLFALSLLWILYVALTTEYFGDDYAFSIDKTMFSRLTYTYTTKNSSKWIIVTTPSLHHLRHAWMTRIKNWRIITVVDDEYGKGQASGHTFSSQFRSTSKNDQVNNTLLFNERTLAYLYAISHGAQIIYELDGNNRLSHDWEKVLRDETPSYKLQCRERTVFNAYRHFGQTELWPRGFPLERNKESSNVYQVTDGDEPALIQVLSNGDADVSDNYRMTLTTNLNVTFDTVAPSVLLPYGIMTPINARNTIFRHSALWAMVIPITPPPEHRDIIRGYWAQRLLWELNCSVAVYPPNSRQFHGNTNYNIQPIFPFAKLISFLMKWTCDQKLTFFQCIINLSKRMAEEGFWNAKDYQIVCKWLERLRLIGYNEPSRQSNVSQHDFYTVSYQPTEQLNSRISGKTLPNKWHQIHGVATFCKNSTFQINGASLASPNILLAIVFSEPFYDNVPYLQLMYGVTFSHIVMCGEKMNDFKKATLKLREKVTFVEMELNHGHHGYKCLLAAMMMNYDVSGYLYIGDDTLVNAWKVSYLPTDKIWYPASSLSLLHRNKTNPWHWWQTKEGRVVFNKAWEEIQQLRNSSSEIIDVLDQFTNDLNSSTGSEQALYAGPSDFVYIPSKYRRASIILLEIFARHKVFLEVVIPTLVGGLVDKKSIVEVQCQYLWYDGKRDKVPEMFKSEDVFLHPVKLSNIKSKLKKFFCQKYFPLLLHSKARKT